MGGGGSICIIPPPRPSKTLGPGREPPGGRWTLIAMAFAGCSSLPGFGGAGITDDDDEGSELGGAAFGCIVEPREGLIEAAGDHGNC